MLKQKKKMSDIAGLPPGTLIHVGTETDEEVKILLINYNEKDFTESFIRDFEDSHKKDEKIKVMWINLDGIHDKNIIENIGAKFGIHSLILEDIMNPGQRPKMDDFEDYIFIVLKMIYYDEENDEINFEQISIIQGSNYVISFQEKQGSVFDPIRERIRKSKGRIRQKEADYLAYALIDNIVDNYFTILENIEDKIEKVEEELITNPTSKTLQKIHKLKRNNIFLRKSILPLRDVINRLERGDSKLLKKSNQIFLRDVYDHIIQINDINESYRDILSGMAELYLSIVSNKMNEVMKVLTIIATIFIPLTFIAGIYGMNFNPDVSPYNLPELKYYWGYPIALLSMVIVAFLMIINFKRKKWL